MLIKLLKYDLKETFKYIVPVYLLMIISSIAYLITQRFADANMLISISNSFLSLVLVFSFIVSIFVTLFSIAFRYYNNILKDEGYLTNTLPVSKNSIVLAKLLSAVITIITSSLIVLLLFKLSYTNFTDFSFMNEEFSPGIDYSIALPLIIVGLLAQLITIVVGFYVAVTLGHSHSNNKIVNSILYGIAIYILMQILMVIAILVALLLNGGFDQYINETTNINTSTLQYILISAVSFYLIWIFVAFYITKTSLKNKLNLE